MTEKGRKQLNIKDEETVRALERIKERLGIKHTTDVVRFLAKRYLEEEGLLDEATEEVKRDFL